MKTRFTLVTITLGTSLALVCLETLNVSAATNIVTSTADSGAGSLRQALASAADGDTIDATSVSGTILLTAGELLVTNSVVIIWSGASQSGRGWQCYQRRVLHWALQDGHHLRP